MKGVVRRNLYPGFFLSSLWLVRWSRKAHAFLKRGACIGFDDDVYKQSSTLSPESRGDNHCRKEIALHPK